MKRSVNKESLGSPFSETTDRLTVRPVVVVRRIDVAIVVEVQVVSVVAVRRTRPIVAVVTNIVEGAIAVVQITRSRYAKSSL